MIGATENRAAASRGRSNAERTCAACRRKAPSRDLLRLAQTPDGGVVPDLRRNLGGRGAHVCPTRKCIVHALKKRSFDRLFNARVRYPSADDLLNAIRSSLLRNITTLLASGSASRFLCAGTDASRKCLNEGKAACMLLASDAAGRGRFEAQAKERSVPTRALPSKDLLGTLTDRRPTGVVAIKDRGLADALMAVADRLEALY